MATVRAAELQGELTRVDLGAALAHGASVRVVNRAPTAVHESRALVLQPRTLEVLAGLGVTTELLRRGRRTPRPAL